MQVRLRRIVVLIPGLLVGLAAAACGGSKKPAEEPDLLAGGAGGEEPAPPPPSGPPLVDADEPRPKDEHPCLGLELNLPEVLSRAACELGGDRAKDDSPKDLKGRLEIAVRPAAQKVTPGGTVDIYVSFTNKGKGVLPLQFVVNPLPRFEIEAFDQKERRVDEPKGGHPPWPGGKEPPAAEEKISEIRLPENGTGRVVLQWTAARSRWAPEKAKGVGIGGSYPKAAGAPLPKGKYTLRIVTPLTRVFEGAEREVTAPKVTIEVGK